LRVRVLAELLNAPPPLQRRLGDAAKKAIGKLQLRSIRRGDQETEADFDNCAVCIEGYRPHDVVRVLPCRYGRRAFIVKGTTRWTDYQARDWSMPSVCSGVKVPK